MNPTVIWDAVAGFARSVNAILSFIPALVWAVALGLVFLWGSFMHHERDSAVSQLNVVKGMYEQLTTKVIHQKLEAAALLKRLTAERDALQAVINERHKAQEIKDANDRKIIDDQAARVRALERDGRLRDPAAGCGGSRPVAEGGAAGDERGSAQHEPAAGGLLSEGISRLLVEHAAAADKWARLFGIARDDALTCRAAMGASP